MSYNSCWQFSSRATDTSRTKSQQFSQISPFIATSRYQLYHNDSAHNCNLAVGAAPQSWKTSDLWLQQFIVNVTTQLAFAINGCKTQYNKCKWIKKTYRSLIQLLASRNCTFSREISSGKIYFSLRNFYLSFIYLLLIFWGKHERLQYLPFYHRNQVNEEFFYQR